MPVTVSVVEWGGWGGWSGVTVSVVEWCGCGGMIMDCDYGVAVTVM